LLLAIVLSFVLCDSLETCDTLVIDSYEGRFEISWKIRRISERMSAGEFAVMLAISPFR
jgi:hypothetical protein